ncbi:MAG: hypothetical protein KKF52_01060 [Nanoarchaeota archaeon]|nr:hypothetical protein [Nanoarchaeota archaeon]MBU4241798.1 hypothetical protein [Nanoarchaeota archaeon]MBU4352322.1 hypothetical protein [Nanoarchaeota archaeon]MCG2720171.1 hypothetical protein [Nanoarchaeota archaeon]
MKKKKKTFKKYINSLKNKISKILGLPLNNNVNEVLKHKMEKGNKKLEKAKKDAIKQFNPKIVEEFDKLAKKKADKLVGNAPKTKMYDNLQLKKKILDNIKRLISPFKSSKKKKEIEVLFPEK